VTELLGPFQSAVMQRALAEAVLMGISCGLLGALVVPRGYTYAAESLAHAMLLGAAIAVVAGGPVLGAGLAAALAAALMIGGLGRRPEVGGDVAVAVVFTAFLAASVMVLEGAHRSADLEGLLFGTILTVAGSDLVLAAAVAVLAMGVAAVLGGRVVIAGFDREFAGAAGVRPALLDTLVLLALAATLAAALRGVGSLLVLSLLVAPAATARVAARRASVAIWLSPLLGVAFAVGGLAIAHYASTDPGPVITLVGIGGFCVALGWSRRPAGATALGRAGP
jgi:ABC-type Mn2+/Zn2+ transport system permease subunit